MKCLCRAGPRGVVYGVALNSSLWLEPSSASRERGESMRGEWNPRTPLVSGTALQYYYCVLWTILLRIQGRSLQDQPSITLIKYTVFNLFYLHLFCTNTIFLSSLTITLLGLELAIDPPPPPPQGEFCTL